MLPADQATCASMSPAANTQHLSWHWHADMLASTATLALPKNACGISLRAMQKDNKNLAKIYVSTLSLPTKAPDGQTVPAYKGGPNRAPLGRPVVPEV